jgi:hypothetical protein
MQTVKDYFNRFGAWSKKRAKHAIVWVAAVGIVLYGLLVDAFSKAKELFGRALHSIKHWLATRCFPWLRNTYYSIDYAFSRAWQWIKIQIPPWREIRAPLIIGLAVVAAFYIPQAFQREPEPTIRAGSQSLHIGPQVDLSDLEDGSDSANAALGLSGEAFFVKTAANGGSNANDCSSWDEACLTPQYVIDNHVIDGRGDTVFVGTGTYDSTNPDGIVVDKARMTLAGVGIVNFENTDTTNGSTVISVTSGTVVLRDFTIGKGEFVSLNSYNIYLDDVGTVTLSNIDMAVAPVAGGPHTGVYVYSGDGIILDDVNITGILFPIGNGIVFSDTVRSGVFNSGILRLGVGILFTGATDELGINQGTQIGSCNIGVQFDRGVTSNTVNAYITDTPVEVVDNSGNGTNTLRGSLTSLRTATEHSGEMYPGTFYVVDGANGLDTNNGRSPEEALATIGRALELVNPGDGVVIRADGVYTENIVVDTNAVQIFASPGVVISGTGTVTPTILVTGDNVWFRRQMDVLASGVGICVEADNVRVDDVTVNSATIAFDIDGDNIVMRNTRAAGYTVAGYDISGLEPDISDAHAGGSGTATIGYVISSTVDSGLFRSLSSVQNISAGFSVTLGAEDNIFVDCTSGTGDGDRVDANLTNMWSNYVDTQSRWRHEHNWPEHDGQGVAADPFVVDNDATDDTPDSRDDINYWGDTVSLIPPDAIDTSWRSLGLEIVAGTASKVAEWQIFYPTPTASAARNGGNLWDLGETVLTTDNTFAFVVSDTIWINSTSDPDGEILIVVEVGVSGVITVASEIRASGNTGIRYNHNGNERAYLVERRGNEAWHSTDGIYSAPSARQFDTLYFAFAKENQAGSGSVIRLLNSSDNLVFTFDAKLKYEATKEHD